MPEELVIFLAIAIGVIWLLVKFLQSIGVLISRISKSYEAASAQKRRKRYTEVRDRLRPYVRAVIPAELDSFEKRLERTRADLIERSQALTELIARPPTWTKKEFKGLSFPRKDAVYSEMCSDEIDAILVPNADSSTWGVRGTTDNRSPMHISFRVSEKQT